MSRWYSKIMADPEDFSTVADAFEWFEKEYADAQSELDVRGKRIEDVSKRLPGIVEYRYGQYVEVKAIVDYLETMEIKARGEARKRYVEHYNRALTERQVERYAEADDNVVAIRLIIAQMKMMRDKFEGLTKGYEHMLFQIGHITKLRIAHMEDSIL